MKAVLCSDYGPPEVLRLVDVDAPRPRAHELLVKTGASTVNSSDGFVRSGVKDAPLLTQLMFRALVGFTRPRRPIQGLTLAGVVVDVGNAVTRFVPGEHVWAFTKLHFGGYAEFTCLEETSSVGPSPALWPDADAAAIVFGGLLGLHYLQRGGVTAGQHILVYGASGAVGTSMVQLAVHMGALVTGVCGPGNAALVRSLGATTVLDYTTERSPPPGSTYDLVVDAVGKRKTSALRTACERALAPHGRCLSVDDGTPEFSAQQLGTLKGLAESGVLRPCIDRVFPLEQMVQAHRYVEGGHKHGNVVITIHA